MSKTQEVQGEVPVVQTGIPDIISPRAKGTIRNAQCACGSGKKYKKCCFKKACERYEESLETIRRFKSQPINQHIPFDNNVVTVPLGGE